MEILQKPNYIKTNGSRIQKLESCITLFTWRNMKHRCDEDKRTNAFLRFYKHSVISCLWKSPSKDELTDPSWCLCWTPTCTLCLHFTDKITSSLFYKQDVTEVAVQWACPGTPYPSQRRDAHHIVCAIINIQLKRKMAATTASMHGSISNVQCLKKYSMSGQMK